LKCGATLRAILGVLPITNWTSLDYWIPHCSALRSRFELEFQNSNEDRDLLVHRPGMETREGPVYCTVQSLYCTYFHNSRSRSSGTSLKSDTTNDLSSTLQRAQILSQDLAYLAVPSSTTPVKKLHPVNTIAGQLPFCIFDTYQDGLRMSAVRATPQNQVGLFLPMRTTHGASGRNITSKGMASDYLPN
jgi:hypothetical protein